tara:strand:+ start:928 stop:1113 length:186 start_codon:yes stop_codon:yes gene_type:complete
MLFTIKLIIQSTPNNSDLGSYYREAHPKSELSRNNPNDSDLGAVVRSFKDDDKLMDVTYVS